MSMQLEPRPTIEFPWAREHRRTRTEIWETAEGKTDRAALLFGGILMPSFMIATGFISMFLTRDFDGLLPVTTGFALAVLFIVRYFQKRIAAYEDLLGNMHPSDS